MNQPFIASRRLAQMKRESSARAPGPADLAGAQHPRRPRVVDMETNGNQWPPKSPSSCLGSSCRFSDGVLRCDDCIGFTDGAPSVMESGQLWDSNFKPSLQHYSINLFISLMLGIVNHTQPLRGMTGVAHVARRRPSPTKAGSGVEALIQRAEALDDDKLKEKEALIQQVQRRVGRWATVNHSEPS